MGFVALWWLKLSVADVFSFGPKSELEEEQRRQAERELEEKRREQEVGQLAHRES